MAVRHDETHTLRPFRLRDFVVGTATKFCNADGWLLSRAGNTRLCISRDFPWHIQPHVSAKEESIQCLVDHYPLNHVGFVPVSPNRRYDRRAWVVVVRTMYLQVGVVSGPSNGPRGVERLRKIM